jgi:ligand-binding sensor domain-containing protein
MIFGGWVSSYINGYSFQQNGLFGSLYDPFNNRIDTLYASRSEHLKKLMTDSAGEMRMACTGRDGELFVLNTEKNTIDIGDIYSSQNKSSPMPFNIKSDLGWKSRLTYINDSLLIITCRNNGFYVLHYNTRNRQLTCYGRKHFPLEVCTSIFKDREGRLWVGTADGLYKQNLHNSFFFFFFFSEQSDNLMNHEIKSIYIENNSIYLGLQNEEVADPE